MNGLPMLLHLRFPTGECTWGLWLPFFLLYPILLVLMLAMSPLVLLVFLVAWPSGWGRPFLMSGVYLWVMLFRLRGLKIGVAQNKNQMLIDFV